MEREINTAKELFEHMIKILGENQLYKLIYGELPVDDDSANRILQMQQMYEQSKPLMDDLQGFVSKKTAKRRGK